MIIIADLHLHSKYSRAVSPKMDLEEIALWADKKGINLVATADWTHPLWFEEIKTKLEESSPGIFKLKQKDYKTRFVLSTEISSIYSQGGKSRRMHYLLISPSIKTAEKINLELQKRGTNLIADGRPITGLPAVDVLKIALDIDQNILFIPAHIWTPWFSLFGSKSGFDSIEEAFGKESRYIYAIETGLSSDPIMNWQINELKNRSIVSFSDAHSGPKLGREATVFISNNYLDQSLKTISFIDLVQAIKNKPGGKLKIGYTIEFFPEEGKYHWSGHRLCQICYSPKQVKEKGEICPVCHRPLTIGVENRVIDLASKTVEKKDLLFIKNKDGLIFVADKEKKHRPFVSIVPLIEILTEINNGSETQAKNQYEKLVTNLGSEFEILLKKNYQDIAIYGGQKLAEAIKIVRERKVFVKPGYDGVFGQVKVFSQEKNEKVINQEDQPGLF